MTWQYRPPPANEIQWLSNSLRATSFTPRIVRPRIGNDKTGASNNSVALWETKIRQQMEDLTAMVVFAKVVEEKSLSGAARQLRLSKSRVSKLVAKLEKSLGARLLNRTTRQMSLTEVGAVFYEHCVRIVEELEQAKLAVSRLHSEPRGTLKLSASVAFGTLHIAPVFADFIARYPEVTIDMTINDRFVDLAEEGYDVAIRIAKDPGQNIVARKLAPVHRRICATPGYFAQRGVPRT